MNNHIDRELNQSAREIASIHNDLFDHVEETPARGIIAAILTLATVTHHQNGMKP